MIKTIYTLAKQDNPDYQCPPHIALIEEKIFELINGVNDKLIITMPPRHGKSEFISKYLPAFLLLQNPKARILLASYEMTFASSWGRKAMNIYKQHRNDLTIERQGYFETEAGGYMDCVGVGGAMTGKGADWIIIDDPVKNAEEAYSLTYRQKTWDWFLSTAYTRKEPDAKIILIQTRWHYDDLAGRILDNDVNKEWQLLTLKAIADEDDILGRQKNEALWPKRFNIEKLNEILQQIGSLWFSALYQQEPSNSELQIIKREWWKYFDDNLEYDYIIQSWDTAFKTDVKNDFSVCTTIGIKDNYYYIFDVFVTKLEYPELEKVAVQLANKYKPSTILIEDKASGQSLLQYLKRFTFLPVKAIKPTVDKVMRCHTAAPYFEQGKVFIKANEKWTFDVIEQFTTFPFGKHDDIVDSITQFINFAKENSLTLNMRRI